MFSKLHNRLGSAGLVVAVVALVAALAGTAFAATKLNGTQKKEVEKIAKKFAGKNGAPGAAGPAGAPGAKGDLGEKGAPGAPGAAGAIGATGATGATGGNGAKGATGPTGTGATGATGTTGNIGATLGSGATETGSWVLPVSPSGGVTQISFPIPLAAPLTPLNFPKFIPLEVAADGHGTLTEGSKLVTDVGFGNGKCTVGAAVYDVTTPANISTSVPQTLVQKCISATEFELSKDAAGSGVGDSLRTGNPNGCPSSATAAEPAAEPGFLCIFVGEGEIEEVTSGFTLNPEIRKADHPTAAGVSTAGAILSTTKAITAPAMPYISGTWALTAP